MQVTPGISFSMRWIIRRRRSKAVCIAWTEVMSPESAASAANWATLLTFEVSWLCRFVAAATISRGPIIQPTRQPVIANVFDTPFTTTQRSASSGSTTGIECCSAPS